MEQKKTIDIDVSTPVLMTLVFLLLKCTNTIDWSWCWIFSPMYIFFGIVIITFAVFGISDVIRWLSSFKGRRGGGGVA